MTCTVAIDAGQTGIKTRVIAGGVTFDRSFPGVLTNAAILPQLAQVIDELAQSAPEPIDTVAAGVSGLIPSDAKPQVLLAQLTHARPERIVLAHDSTTSYLAARGAETGAVIAAGTGIVTLAVGAEATARVDGWGNIMGDAGAGYWIGREALDAVMRAYDRRGPETTLTRHVEARWPMLEEAYIDLQASEHRVRIVAEFAEAVATESEAGDTVALEISQRAAQEAAHSVLTALRRVDLADAHAQVCALGGVFRSSVMRGHFVRQLAERAPKVELVPPQGHGIDGAVTLATLDADHPLASHIWSFVANEDRE